MVKKRRTQKRENAKKSSPRRRRASTPPKTQRRLYFRVDPDGDIDKAAETVFAALRQLLREEDPEASAQLEARLAREARAAAKKSRPKRSK